ncbi:hypothetical protein [Frigidibacter sp. MR17.24]|uniref:hypothetical protein n=1 Tax=Frigidibacter sp. MR17.24 TaxID=3127345 RepID=UPI003012A617
MTAAKTTQDHDTIRNWAIARGGQPARVAGEDILRIDFTDPGGEAEDGLEAIDWDAFFRIFDDRGLEFLYQDMTSSGDESRFCKFVLPDQSIHATPV